MDKFDSEVQWRVGFVYTNRGEFEEARVFLKRAIEFNPNDADALTVMGVYLTAIGEHDEAVVFCEKAMRLNPFCPGYYLWNLALAYHAARRYADVLGPMQEYVSRYPKFMKPRRLLASAYARLGRMEEAKREIDTFLTAQPDASLKDIREREARRWKRTSDLEHSIESLRMAGFPE